jgi:asparagine synthase (glutamine-hydrolysing)
MCGICGIISKKPVAAAPVESMNRALIHRGPDGEGQFTADGLHLAMRRLSIIDIGTGWQPLYNEDRSLAMVMNGEIYNFVELRQMLRQKGHRFSTEGDGETILHLYEEYGTACLQYLRGMFAFALWDSRKKQLFIARDRMGEKPLYLYQENDRLLFSSEIRSLLASGMIHKEPDPFAIDLFFHYQYIPEPHTIIKGVRKLEAGHYLLVDQETMAIQDHCYWNMEDAPPLEGDPVELIRKELAEISRLVIRADVPVGVALSGGIDSALVAALAVKQYKGNMHAFTVGYEGRPETDERTAAAKIAAHLGMPFHEIELRNADVVSDFPKVCGLTDDPIADISAFGYYSVSKAARQHNVPVLLQGQGGDELFWGYKWVRDNYKQVLLKDRLLDHKAGLMDYYRYTFGENYTKPTLKKFAKGLLSYPDAAKLYKRHQQEDASVFPFYDFTPDFNVPYKNYYGDLLRSQNGKPDSSLPFRVERPWANPAVTLTRLISQTYLLENGIAQGDRLSMANSVELRLPLVDYRLVETAIGIRKAGNDIHLGAKAYLKAVGKDLLPAWVFESRKRGFEPPVLSWIEQLVKSYGGRLPEGRLVSGGILSSKAGLDLSRLSEDQSHWYALNFKSLVLELHLDSLLSS